MNLRGIANAATKAINPNVTCTRQRSTGSITRPGGVRVPQYATDTLVVQVQALSAGELRQLDGLNIQGVRRAVYANGVIAGAIRAARVGGDILVFPAGTLPEGNTWLCVHVLEQWPDWCKIAVTLQDGPSAFAANPGQLPSLDFSQANNSQYLPGVET